MATEPDGSTHYSLASLQRIDDKVSRALSEAREKEWVKSSELAIELHQFIAVSLYNSQWRRINFNPTLPLGVIDDDDLRAVRAKDGTATPADLLELLIAYPELGSLELAKLSHPLDARATEAMDTDIRTTLENARKITAEPEYEMKRTDTMIPAGIVLRKQHVFDLETQDGVIGVTKLTSLLVRGDSEANESGYIDRKIKNPARFEELSAEIDENLYKSDLKWLQPIATSYYAKYPGKAVLDADD
jgi:hypothetical protein